MVPPCDVPSAQSLQTILVGWRTSSCDDPEETNAERPQQSPRLLPQGRRADFCPLCAVCAGGPGRGGAVPLTPLFCHQISRLTWFTRGDPLPKQEPAAKEPAVLQLQLELSPAPDSPGENKCEWSCPVTPHLTAPRVPDSLQHKEFLLLEFRSVRAC